MTPDELVVAGAAFAEANIKMIEDAHGDMAAMAFAGAIASAARDWAAHRFGARCAFELMTGLAEDTLGQSMADAEHGGDRCLPTQ